MNETTARVGLGLVIPLATVATILGPYLALRSELPDRVATHFDGSGTPDGSMTPGMLILTTMIMAGVGLVGCIGLALARRPLPAAIAPTVGFLGGFFAGMGAGIAVVTVLGQRNIDDWTEASGLGWLIAVPILLGVAAGAVGGWLSSRLPTGQGTHVATEQPTMELADGQHAVWTETMESTWLLRFGLIAMVVGVVVAVGTFWWLAIPAVIVGVAMTSLATFRVRVDRTGMHIRFGYLPGIGVHLPTSEIERASVLDVRAMEWGGWGYRGSLKLMNKAALVHRAGPGIRLDLDGGRVFVVTVDRPDEAVALLNAEIRRHAPAT